MPRRIEGDDEVYRFRAVWLGPADVDLPFHARYLAYGVGFSVFAAILLFEAITPLSVGVPPMWEFSITIFLTCVVMSAVDHDKPLAAVLHNAATVARTPRPASDRVIRHRPALAAIKVHEKAGQYL